MEPKNYLLTKEGLDKLEAELQDLRLNKREEIAEKLKVARAQGDLSENAEYDAAKDAQRDNEARIAEIEEILKHAEVIDEDEGDEDTVSLGCSVRFLDMEFDDELEYRIVGSTESDSLNGLISNESPVGAALIGAKTGDIVTATTDAGPLKFKILEVKKNSGRKSN